MHIPWMVLRKRVFAYADSLKTVHLAHPSSLNGLRCLDTIVCVNLETKCPDETLELAMSIRLCALLVIDLIFMFSL